MKVLQINGYESPGRRFNGLSLIPYLHEHGVESTHYIWEKDTNDNDVLTSQGKFFRIFNKFIRGVEKVLSLQSVLFPTSREIMSTSAFKNADIVHLHIIHSGYLSLLSLGSISKKKPLVWTLHDPWAMTGHCIYPFECKKWISGCSQCENLNTHFSLRRDNTRLLFKFKEFAYKRAKFDVIVASIWMENMVKQSPLFKNVRIHRIPFGLDLNFFSPSIKSDFRNLHSISYDSIVISFRAVDNEFKGLPHIITALEKINTDQKICLLTFNSKGLMEKFSSRFQIVELGWTNDEVEARNAYLASDIFLMPSTAEAFGVMAIEAMACGKPVICFDGTSLPEVTAAPGIGISVPMGDSDALAASLQRLLDNPDERLSRGKIAREYAEKHYDIRLQAEKIAEVYRGLVA